jgi:hypothetical protein
MFFEFKHGGHALAKGAEGPKAPQGRADVVTPERAGDDFDPDTMTPFRYMIDTSGDNDLLPVSTETVKALDALGEAIITRPPDDRQDDNPDSNIPPIFTYWSQLIDHELTARTDRTSEVSDITVDAANLKPVNRPVVERNLLNRRTPALELDCLYGDGPPGDYGNRARRARDRNIRLARKLRDGANMRVGTAEVVNRPLTRPGPNPGDPPVAVPNGGEPVGPVPPPANDLHRDLPRIGALLALGVVKEDEFPASLQNNPTFRQRAFIGDPRNDENLVIAQFHLALLRFHNAVVDWLRFKDPRQERRDTDELFEDARKIVRWTFQWLTVNQFLKTVLRPDVVDSVVRDGATLYTRALKGSREPYMPVEFSVACYRFGHSMVRNVYDYNRNFGRKPAGGPGFVIPNASLSLLFRFTGKSLNPFNGGTQVLPHNWIIEWDRFDGTSPHDAADGQPAHVTRKIDTHLAPRLGEMPNEGNDAVEGVTDEEQKRLSELLKHLARRNLRRGYQLSISTGQAMARAIDAGPLTRDELSQGNSAEMNQAMEAGGFFDRTPLWFYVLKEAEVREDGQRLGEVGSRVVAETIIGVLLNDPESYLSQKPDWSPSEPTPRAGGPLRLPDGHTISTIGDLLRFAAVAV